MMIFLLVATVIALVLTTASLFVILLVRLAEDRRDTADMRRLAAMQRRRGHHIPR
jgi:hypothetical protein